MLVWDLVEVLVKTWFQWNEPWKRREIVFCGGKKHKLKSLFTNKTNKTYHKVCHFFKYLTVPCKYHDTVMVPWYCTIVPWKYVNNSVWFKKVIRSHLPWRFFFQITNVRLYYLETCKNTTNTHTAMKHCKECS